MGRRSPEVLERIRDAASLAAREFIDRHLFGGSPWAFRASPPEYDEFRAELAHRLAVDAGGIALVGSGRLGFSLNPHHLLSSFGSASDLDVVVVYLRPDHLPLTTKLAHDWFPKLASRFESQVASRHEVKAWLFKSELHARVLYADHLSRVQSDIRRMVSFSESE